MRSMTRRDGKAKPMAIANSATAPPADLLVCFPARAHLTLLPKPVCSPARAPETNRRRHHHLPKKPAAARSSQPLTQASPLLWAKTKPPDSGEMASEPTSPKVTCAGQIKIRAPSTRTRTRSSKNWQSVMEDIERIHNKKKSPSWGNSLGFKREIVHFLSCLRGFRFDFRCFRGFPESDVTTEDELEEEDDEDEEETNEASRTMFSKWFMVLQEEDEDVEFRKQEKSKPNSDVVSELEPPSAPPPNALLLMRCRSAPATGWLERKPIQEDGEEEEEEEDEKQTKISLKVLMEEEKEVVAKKENLMVMDYDADFYKLSSDIAKETWVVSGSSRCSDDPLVRSRSWKRW